MSDANGMAGKDRRRRRDALDSTRDRRVNRTASSRSGAGPFDQACPKTARNPSPCTRTAHTQSAGRAWAPGPPNCEAADATSGLQLRRTFGALPARRPPAREEGPDVPGVRGRIPATLGPALVPSGRKTVRIYLNARILPTLGESVERACSGGRHPHRFRRPRLSRRGGGSRDALRYKTGLYSINIEKLAGPGVTCMRGGCAGGSRHRAACGGTSDRRA